MTAQDRARPAPARPEGPSTSPPLEPSLGQFLALRIRYLGGGGIFWGCIRKVWKREGYINEENSKANGCRLQGVCHGPLAKPFQLASPVSILTLYGHDSV